MTGILKDVIISDPPYVDPLIDPEPPAGTAWHVYLAIGIAAAAAAVLIFVILKIRRNRK